jgi:hypothetical protein
LRLVGISARCVYVYRTTEAENDFLVVMKVKGNPG